MSENILIVGRFHGMTADQEKALVRAIEQAGSGRLVFVIDAADQAGTKRHPLTAEQRREIVTGFAQGLDRPFTVHAVTDIKDSTGWIAHIKATVADNTAGATMLLADNTKLVSANPDVVKRFQDAGYETICPGFQGAMPADLLSAIASGAAWQSLATDVTLEVFARYGIADNIREIFADVLLTDDGELSDGRDFSVYVAGMDASLAVKIDDICPFVLPGTIVDKGCGSGTLLIHLSELFPTSQIIGMDLSRELLQHSESQHYPQHNVSVVRGNIIEQRFPAGSVTTVIFSSVLHEVFSYNGYDREQVRKALRNARAELQPGGRLIIRDGVSPGTGTVWMHCDAETERRFRRFAGDFKSKSATPGIAYDERVVGGQSWFVLSLHEANEFLSKKDYLDNWTIEVNEEFGVFDLEGWSKELGSAGYRVLNVQSYVNPWVLEHRYKGRVVLHADDHGIAPGSELPFPATTAVIVAEAS